MSKPPGIEYGITAAGGPYLRVAQAVRLAWDYDREYTWETMPEWKRARYVEIIRDIERLARARDFVGYTPPRPVGAPSREPGEAVEGEPDAYDADTHTFRVTAELLRAMRRSRAEEIAYLDGVLSAALPPSSPQSEPREKEGER